MSRAARHVTSEDHAMQLPRDRPTPTKCLRLEQTPTYERLFDALESGGHWPFWEIAGLFEADPRAGRGQ